MRILWQQVLICALLGCFSSALSAQAPTITPDPTPRSPVVITTLDEAGSGGNLTIRAGSGAPLISGPTLLCKGSSGILKVEGDYESFEWSTGSTERYITIDKEGIYEVTVKTKHGCTFTSSVNVQVRICT